MSYDLFFYKKKGHNLSNEEISNYLTTRLGDEYLEHGQWVYNNKDTCVYFSLELLQAEENEEPEEEFDDYENTNYFFNLNYIRPPFFGLESFMFVEKLCDDLDLCVVNPQGDTEMPYKPNAQEQFECWSEINEWSIKNRDGFSTSLLMPHEKVVAAWEYNVRVKEVQERLGHDYFVPLIYFYKTKDNPIPFTLTVWTEHIPIVIPETDYILLTRKYKKLFRTMEDVVLISRETFLKTFGMDLSNFELPNTFIIHAKEAVGVKNKFNSIKADKKWGYTYESLSIEDVLAIK